MKTLSEQIEAEIRRSGLTRYEISKRSGVVQSVLSKLRNSNGAHMLTTDVIERLAEALDLEIVLQPKAPKAKRPARGAAKAKKKPAGGGA